MSELIDLENLEAESARLVDAAVASGADACDVVVAHGQSLSVGTRNGKTENTERSEGDQISLRVFVGERVASVSANEMHGFKELAERAVAMAKVSPEDPFQGLMDADAIIDKSAIDSISGELDLFDAHTPSSADLTDMALEAEEAGLAVSGVEQSMGASASWGVTGFVLATSNGFVGNYKRSRFSISAAMVAGTGTSMERDYDFMSKTHLNELPDAGSIGRSAGERVVKRLNPRQAESGAYPIVYDRRVSNSLLGAMMAAINGASIARKTSFLRDKMGEQIAHPSIQVIDDPRMARGTASRPFDGEGLACDALELIKNGVLQEWVLDGASARELGLASNGRASRSGSGTSPSTTNCRIAPGEVDLEGLLEGIGSGLYLTETIGHGVNMVSGDYSKGASGFWIENGQIAYPVAEITIAGNLKDMFLEMVPANDLEFKFATNAPTLRVEGMTVGGK